MSWREELSNKAGWWIAAVLVLLPVLSFSELFFADRTLYRDDIASFYYPLSVFKARVLGSGEIPFWNPHILFGFPQLADSDLLGLYPLNLLFLLPLRPTLTFSLFVLLHFVLAGLSSYLLARAIEIGRTGAAVTAVTFTLSGYLMAQVTNVSIMTGSVWLPLMFFLLFKAFQKRSAAYAALCGGVVALQVLGSHPQPVFYSLLTLGAYGAFSLFGVWRDKESTPQEKRSLALRLTWLMAIPVLLGLSLAAIQIVPTWELKSLSPRAAGLSYEAITSYSLPPYNLLTFLFPNILGNPVIGYFGEETFEELHAYIGILPLMLVLWAWARKERNRHVAFFTFLAGVALLLALGRYTPVYRLLAYVPGFDFFRVPARWLFIATFSLSIVAGYGFDSLAAVHERPGSRSFAVLWNVLFWLNLVVSLLLLAGLALGPQAIQFVEGVKAEVVSGYTLDRARLLTRAFTRLPLVQVTNNLPRTLSSLSPSLLYVVLSNAGFLLVFLWKRRKISAAAFGGLALALIVVDLLIMGGTTINPVRRAAYLERPVGSTAFLQEHSGLYRNLPVVRKDDVRHLLDDMATAYGLYSAQGHISELTSPRYQKFLDALGGNPALLNLAGVRYLLMDKGATYPGAVRVYEGRDQEVHENPAVLPRAFVVPRAEILPSEEAVLKRMQSEDWDPERTAILEEQPVPALNRDDLPPEGGPAPAEIASYAPHRVVVEADTGSGGFLILTDSYYPGWQAYVDGQETGIYRADYLFRAVLLDPGRHTVEFRYRPMSFRIGLVIALAAGAIVCVVAVFSSVVRRRRRASSRP